MNEVCSFELHVFLKKVLGLFEILERNKQLLLGALFYIVLPSPPLGLPPLLRLPLIGLTRLQKGGKGMLPACCLPLWGREGGTLMAAAENKRITQKKRILTKPFF
jgi:hypothetical protein